MSVLAASPGRQLADGDDPGFAPALGADAAPPRILSTEQIEEFKATGVLILRGFVDDAQVEHWKAQAWEKLGARQPCAPRSRASPPSAPPRRAPSAAALRSQRRLRT